MNRSFSLFLALRYLKPRRTFLSIITLISVLGVTLGIMVMIVVISVMTGFDLELKKKIVGFDAHLVVLKQDGILDEWRELLPLVEKTPEVVAAAPFVFGPIVVEIQKEGFGKRIAPKVRAVRDGGGSAGQRHRGFDRGRQVRPRRQLGGHRQGTRAHAWRADRRQAHALFAREISTSC